MNVCAYTYTVAVWLYPALSLHNKQALNLKGGGKRGLGVFPFQRTGLSDCSSQSSSSWGGVWLLVAAPAER